MNERETDQKLRELMRAHKTRLPQRMEETIMNTLNATPKKRNLKILLLPAAAAVLLVAGIVAASQLLLGKAPSGASLATDGGAQNGSELTQNFKEYKTVAEAEQALGITILEPSYTAGAAYEKVTVYFGGTEPNNVSIEYRKGGKSAYLYSQSFVSDEDGRAYVDSWEKMKNEDGSQFYEKTTVDGNTVYLLQADGGYNAEMVKGTLYINVGSLEEKLGKEDILKILESLQ